MLWLDRRLLPPEGFLSVSFAHVFLDYIFLAWSVFESLGIPERVQSVVSTTRAWAHTGNHDYSAFIEASHERLSKNHGELILSEWHMAMAGLLVHGSDAFLEGKQGSVDFGSLGPPLFVIGLSVAGPFRACQVHE